MGFVKGVYGRRYAKFHNCVKCGKKFEKDEEIWKRSGNLRNVIQESYGAHILAYYCKGCYEGMFIDV